jgi:hypothetical protein
LKPAPPPQTLGDNLIRTLIFVIGTGAAFFFLFWFRGFVSIVLALTLITVAGRALRASWGPWGRVAESAAWLIFAVGALLLVGFAWTGETGQMLVLGILIGFAGYQIWELVQGVRRAVEPGER